MGSVWTQPYYKGASLILPHASQLQFVPNMYTFKGQEGMHYGRQKRFHIVPNIKSYPSGANWHGLDARGFL